MSESDSSISTAFSPPGGVSATVGYSCYFVTYFPEADHSISSSDKLAVIDNDTVR